MFGQELSLKTVKQHGKTWGQLPQVSKPSSLPIVHTCSMLS
ncbi:hypothetical protein SSIN_0450 [Streptococcus sinensis]|uniref:Uncharacterized protein n=1 Tax=Streptococcus sinensis TaxID=176090 RepID=A0A0A0DLD1_9STRE|nr:hypothetical protein SSIN_0450 [Streptococcus sinensis]